MAKILDLAPMSILIVGGGFIGKELAYKMQEGGKSIIIIENNERKVDDLLKEGLYVINADASNENIYKTQIDIKNIKGVITTSEDDWLNLRVCQIFKKLKPEIKAVSIINDLKSRDVFESIGVKTINPSEAIVTVLSDTLADEKD